MASLESVLNPEGVRFVELIDDLGLERLQTRYTFMDDGEFKDLLLRDLGEGMRIYWYEILQRSHLTAVTAILRSRRWLSGVVQARTGNNLLVFASAFRGLMESAADASTALIGTPLTLAHLHPSIDEALRGSATNVTITSEVEDELIHYAHARRLTASERSNLPRSHEARQTREYLQIFGDQNADLVRQCYGDLCELTHPAASTVAMWLALDDQNGLEFSLLPHQDEAFIAGLLRDYSAVPLELLMFAFNGPVTTLNILNYFPVEDFHTPKLLNWNLDGIPAWVKCRDELEPRGIRPQASLG